MSFAEIVAQLDKLSTEELRRLAMKSWSAFLEKDGMRNTALECEEDDPDLLAALHEAVAKADATPGQGLSAREVRARLGEWTSK